MSALEGSWGFWFWADPGDGLMSAVLLMVANPAMLLGLFALSGRIVVKCLILQIDFEWIWLSSELRN